MQPRSIPLLFGLPPPPSVLLFPPPQYDNVLLFPCDTCLLRPPPPSYPLPNHRTEEGDVQLLHVYPDCVRILTTYVPKLPQSALKALRGEN